MRNVNNFPKWLQKMMDVKGWNQSETAKAIGVSRSAITDLMNEKYPPSIKMLEKLTKAFGVPIEEGYIAAGLLPTESPLDARRRRIMEKVGKIKSEKDLETVEGLANILLRAGEHSTEETSRNGKVARTTT